LRAKKQTSKTTRGRNGCSKGEFRFTPELASNHQNHDRIPYNRDAACCSRAGASATAQGESANQIRPKGTLEESMSVTSGTKTESGLGETVRVIVHALLIALVIRTFLFQPFNIPSGSMKATLLVGDYLFVSKYSYGYSHFSIPQSPHLFTGRIFGSEPSRGDIVVFRLPRDTEVDYIKRVIGLPGDRIQMRDGLLYINDQPVQRERLADFIGEDPCGSDAMARVKRWKETLPNGVSYETLDCVDNGFYDNTNVYTVPPGNFFMMGDNRDNSTDSRVPPGAGVGYVPFENIVGRAQMIFFSIAEGEQAWMFWRWPVSVRWNRLFKIVR
jgi:signal peptidase I